MIRLYIIVFQLLISCYALSQKAYTYENADLLDDYFGEVNERILANQFTEVNAYSCSDSLCRSRFLIQREIYNPKGLLVKKEEGLNIEMGQIGSTNTFQYESKDGKLLIKSSRLYYPPFDSYQSKYYHLFVFDSNGSFQGFKWPKDRDSNILIRTEYLISSDKEIKKKRYDARNKIIEDTILERQKINYSNPILFNKGSYNVKEQTYVKDGKKYLIRNRYTPKGLLLDSATISFNKGSKEEHILRTIYFFYNEGFLMKRELQTDNSNRIIREKNYEYDKKSNSLISTVVADYIMKTKETFNNDNNIVERVETHLGDTYKKTKYYYTSLGLIDRIITTIDDRVLFTLKYEYK